jgi:hypothetical protein
MELTLIAGGPCRSEDDDPPPCSTGDCPTVYTDDDGSIVVQGYLVDRQTPDGEGSVRIPADVLLEAASALGR